MQKHPDLPEKFAKLGVEAQFLRALEKIRFTEPSDIQNKLIPLALAGKDILGQAKTGTGKTCAFGLPMLQTVDPKGRLQAFCLTPTRELAVQVAAEMRRFATETDLHIVPVYGGQKISTQEHLLGRRTQLIVGTPGRVLDLLNRGILNFSQVKLVVLDEVDRMLDIGFRDDIRRILSRVTGPHQTIFVSATIDEEIKRLARTHMTDPIEVDVSRDEITVEEVDQFYCSVQPFDKYRLLSTLLKEEKPKLTIIFCNTKAGARKLAQKLHADGYNAMEIHGDLVQSRRERVMDRFRKHKIQMLVATDLAARGIDVSSISHIINYDIPPDPEVYVHRIGRTARMGERGCAITFVTPEQGKEITQVEVLINKLIEERKYSGFNPRPPRETKVVEPPPEQPKPSSRVMTSAPSDTNGPTKKAPPKTLGSKFRPLRRRR
jgi:ATP-dependent RNA helicase DeaD